VAKAKAVRESKKPKYNEASGRMADPAGFLPHDPAVPMRRHVQLVDTDNNEVDEDDDEEDILTEIDDDDDSDFVPDPPKDVCLSLRCCLGRKTAYSALCHQSNVLTSLKPKTSNTTRGNKAKEQEVSSPSHC
jgi:hypothetical protein